MWKKRKQNQTKNISFFMISIFLCGYDDTHTNHVFLITDANQKTQGFEQTLVWSWASVIGSGPKLNQYVKVYWL